MCFIQLEFFSFHKPYITCNSALYTNSLCVGEILLLYRAKQCAMRGANSTVITSDQVIVSIHMLQSHEEYTNSATFSFNFKTANPL